MTSVALNILKVKCPKCGRESIIQVDETIIEEARSNPLGMAGVVEIHGDHALIIYIDRNGNERGMRIYSLLKKDVTKHYTEFTISPKELEKMRNVAGFILHLKKLGIMIKGYTGPMHDSYKAAKENAVLEIDFKEDIPYKTIKHWTQMVVEAINTSYSDNPKDYLNAIKILDVMLEERPFIYANKVFWLVTNASTLTMKTKLPEKLLLKNYRPSIIYERYEVPFINHIIELPQEKVDVLINTENPQIMFSRAEAVLSLYRRGIIDVVIE